MTDEQFTKVCTSMLHDIRKRTPWKTGNLADKATLIRPIGANEIRIYVDENIAPYFRYVNDRQYFQPRKLKYKNKASRQKRNYNYRYFQKAVEKSIENLARKVDGEIIR